MKNVAIKKDFAGAAPEGYHSITPFLIADNATGLIEFLKKAFGAEQTFITKHDDGKIIHATVQIGDSTIMIADKMEGMPTQNAMLYIYVNDVDAIYRQAVAANGTSVHEPTDEFYGDRAGAVRDEWGNTWWMATQREEIDPKELDRRAKEVFDKQKKDKEVHA